MDSFFPDVLTFPDDSHDGQMEAPFTGMTASGSYFPQQGSFLESNADLNSFFPGSGLTPLGTPGMGSYGGSNGFTWTDDQQMLDVAGYLMPPQTMQAPTTLDPSAVTETVAANNTSSSDSSHPQHGNPHGEDLSKPKRGRPRKKRDKKQLTPAEENAKRQKFLERNRLAASKCRDRKKNWTQDTMDKLAREERRHVDLRLEYNRLHTEVTNLMSAACEHLGQCEKIDTEFQECLSMVSERVAAIGRLHSGMMDDRQDHDEYEDGDDAGSPGSDEPPRKRARSNTTRNSSIDESVQSFDDSLSPAPFTNREIRALKRQSIAPQQILDQQVEKFAQSSRISRRGSINSAGSGGDRDSGISARGSPIKAKFQDPSDEGFFGSEDSKSSADITTHHHVMPPLAMPAVRMMPNPRISNLGGQVKNESLLYAQNFASKVNEARS